LATIGVFDSGVGGLSILDEALKQLPRHHYIYLADSANAPYGEKSASWITNRSLQICRYLVDQGCDAIVVACNTATAEAIAQIRRELQIPIIGVEPGIKPAAMQSQNGVVGVLATEATLNSDKFNALLATLPSHCRFIKQAGAGLVPLIENGQIESAPMRALLQTHLKGIIEAQADTLVLGCTHYPFLKSQIRELIGASVTIVDTSDAVVRQLGRQLEQYNLAEETGITSLKLLSTANGDTLHAMAERLLQTSLSPRSIDKQSLMI
jgi:glutamate racemase